MALAPAPVKHEVDRYLAELPLLEDHKDPLNWWRVNEHHYPNLSRMARHYVSVPASSVPAERLFSRAGDIVTKWRNRLLEKRTRLLLLLQSWQQLPEYDEWEINAEELVEEDDDEEGIWHD